MFKAVCVCVLINLILPRAHVPQTQSHHNSLLPAWSPGRSLVDAPDWTTLTFDGRWRIINAAMVGKKKVCYWIEIITVLAFTQTDSFFSLSSKMNRIVFLFAVGFCFAVGEDDFLLVLHAQMYVLAFFSPVNNAVYLKSEEKQNKKKTAFLISKWRFLFYLHKGYFLQYSFFFFF